MPTPNLVLMLLIGVVFGGVAAVILRGTRGIFLISILLGIIGATLGAFFPVLIGQSPVVDVSSTGYLIRAVLGAFLLLLVSVLFRSAKPQINR